MDYKKVMKTALLAGQLMVKSGAEMRRVEDTMEYILKSAKNGDNNIVYTVFAVATGMTMSLWVDDKVYTYTTRIKNRETNLNSIYLVNNVSRDLSSGKINIDEAYEKLKKIKEEKNYSKTVDFIAHILIGSFFTLALGGSLYDFIASVIVGLSLVSGLYVIKRIGFNNFCIVMVSAFSTVFSAYLLEIISPININRDLIIIGVFTPLLPGVSFTTAIRDTLNGDYISGMARMLEAIVIALSMAVGAGVAIWIFNQILI